MQTWRGEILPWCEMVLGQTYFRVHVETMYPVQT